MAITSACPHAATTNAKSKAMAAISCPTTTTQPKPTHHVLDPDGDVIITLRNCSAPFAVWEPETVEPQNPAEPADSKQASSESLAVQYPHHMQPHKQFTTTTTDTTDTDKPVTYQCSSRNLILVSPIFRTMLTGPWAENQVDANGMRHIEADGWNDEAFLHCLNIIHGYAHLVPTHMGIVLLSQITAIMDYYKLHNVLAIVGQLWCRTAEEDIPEPGLASHEIAMRFAFVSHQFGREAMFREATASAIQHSFGKEGRWIDIPVSETILDHIAYRRAEALDTIRRSLLDLKHDLIQSTPCEAGCSARQLAHLVKFLAKHGLDEVEDDQDCITMPASPDDDFYSMSYHKIVSTIRNLGRVPPSRETCHSSRCRGDRLARWVSGFSHQWPYLTRGLDLADFEPCGWSRPSSTRSVSP